MNERDKGTLEILQKRYKETKEKIEFHKKKIREEEVVLEALSDSCHELETKNDCHETKED